MGTFPVYQKFQVRVTPGESHSYGKHIIRTIVSSGGPSNGFKPGLYAVKREWQLHATKGWRSRRVAS